MRQRPQRIMIVGGPGSGKSTLARALGQRTGLPVHHMDRIHWCPGWRARPREARIALAHAVEDGAAWIFEGGLSATYAHRAARADLAIWLDLPLSLRLWRILRRTWSGRGQTRPDLPPDCPERFDRGKWELIRFMWQTRHSARAALEAAFAAEPGLPVLHLRRRAEIAAVVERIAGGAVGMRAAQ